MVIETVTVAERFNGPPTSGNGGYVSGLLARYLPGTVTVRLRLPPPIGVPLRVEAGADAARLLQGETVIAEARCSELALDPPPPPSFAEAEHASQSFSGFVHHVLPTCFVCGTRRCPGDGLRIYPGAVGRGQLLAAPWIPDPSLADGEGVRPEFLWSALDCTGAFAVLPEGGKFILLGEFTARLNGTVFPGEECVVAGWPLGVEGRKRYAGTAVFSGRGELVAAARATWIEVPIASIAGANER